MEFVYFQMSSADNQIWERLSKARAERKSIGNTFERGKGAGRRVRGGRRGGRHLDFLFLFFLVAVYDVVVDVVRHLDFWEIFGHVWICLVVVNDVVVDIVITWIFENLLNFLVAVYDVVVEVVITQ